MKFIRDEIRMLGKSAQLRPENWRLEGTYGVFSCVVKDLWVHISWPTSLHTSDKRHPLNMVESFYLGRCFKPLHKKLTNEDPELKTLLIKASMGVGDDK